MWTRKESLDVMFRSALPKLMNKNKKKNPVLYDLGSGDGRVVIEAARHGYQAIGIELNPALVAFSYLWSKVDRVKRGWPQGAQARFQRRDLWQTDLADADVVLVYGLTPIMDRLSAKLIQETNPNVVVISNVFHLNSQWHRVFEREQVNVYKKQIKKVVDS